MRVFVTGFCTCSLVSLLNEWCSLQPPLTFATGAIPIIFAEHRGWKQVVSVLPFLAILVGTITGAAINTYNQFRYNKIAEKIGKSVVPEARLPPMAFGSVLFTAGMFTTGWTADPR